MYCMSLITLVYTVLMLLYSCCQSLLRVYLTKAKIGAKTSQDGVSAGLYSTK